MLRQIILDTETTGLLTTNGHRVIEIACLEMINRRFTEKRFHSYLNPGRPVDKDAFAIHGLSDEFLKGKPLFSAIVAEFLDFITGAELVIHNAPFDIGFLNYELKLLGNNTSIHQCCTITDTLKLARNKHPGQSNNLDALCRRYQVNNSSRDLHGALIDAKLLGQVYLAMTTGQEQLFASEGIAAPAQGIEKANHAAAQKRKRPALPIIQPTPEESKTHQEFLENMKKKGPCLWEDS